VREECLNQHMFDDPQHARELCEAGREDTTRSGRTRRSEDSLPANSWLSTRTGMPARVLRRCPRAPTARQPAPLVRTLQPKLECEITTGPNLGVGSRCLRGRVVACDDAARRLVRPDDPENSDPADRSGGLTRSSIRSLLQRASSAHSWPASLDNT
jgi:hypothetical protein